MDSFTSPTTLDIKPTTYLCQSEGRLKSLEIRPDGYEFLKDYGRCSNRKAKTRGPELANKLGLEWRTSHTRIHELVEFRRIRKIHKNRLKKEAKERAISEFNSIGNGALSKWLMTRANEDVDVALATLVRLCNKIAKRFPKYKERSDYENSMVEAIYELKDYWIESYAEYGAILTSAVLSAEFFNTYTDWDALHHMRNITGEWQDEDDYLIAETTTFYAYEFNVAGDVFRFHSQACLVPDCPEDTSAHGATEPISDEELGSYGLSELDAVLALAIFLDLNAGEIGYKISKKSKEKPKQHSREDYEIW